MQPVWSSPYSRSAPALPVAATSSAQRPTFVTPCDPQEGFEVQVLVGGLWQRVGAAAVRPLRARARPRAAGGRADGVPGARAPRAARRRRRADRPRGSRRGPRDAGRGHSRTRRPRFDRSPRQRRPRCVRLDDRATFPGRTRDDVLRPAARVEPKVGEGCRSRSRRPTSLTLRRGRRSTTTARGAGARLMAGAGSLLRTPCSPNAAGRSLEPRRKTSAGAGRP